jgi:hypothetical protein
MSDVVPITSATALVPVSPPESAPAGEPVNRTHELNELSFELPQTLHDKTMHVFALTDDGPNEFNVVVSRAKITKEDDLAEFADRLSDELKRALPKFQLKRRQEARVDQSPAIELYYAWTNNGIAMQQRQAIVFVQSASDASEPEALLIAATCAKNFNEHWHATFDSILASTRLRRPWPLADMETSLIAAGASAKAGPQFGFALARDGTLHVVLAVSLLSELIGPDPSNARWWKFYRSDGRALEVLQEHSSKAKSPGPAKSDGEPPAPRFVVSENFGPLQHRLATIEKVFGELQTLAAVADYLKQSKQEGSARPSGGGGPGHA